MTEAVEAELPATEATVTEPETQVVFASLKEAVATLKANEETRMYRVIQGQGAVKRTKIVIASSKSAAALAVVGEENVDLVSLKEKMNAAVEAIQDAKKNGAA